MENCRSSGIPDLRFQLQEAQDWLNENLDLALPPGDIASLHGQLEGWITGWQLMTIALMQGLAQTDGLIVSGRQRFVADYLLNEVLDDLSPKKRHFMVQTSIPENLCSSLCEAVTGEAGAQEMLEELEREGLFLRPLDDRREWYRYHPIFAEFLGAELHRLLPDKVADLHSRAAQWHLAEGLLEPAFHHAVVGLDDQVVSQIAERHFETMLHTGQLKLLRRWLDALPEEWQFQYPVIGLTEAQWLAFAGAVDACRSQLDRVEQALLESERDDRRWQLARVTTVRCQIACFQNNLAQAEPLAELALQGLPETDHHFLASIHHSLGEAYRQAGLWQEAREHYQKALAAVQDPGFRIRATHIYGALADVELRQGRLHNAAGYWQNALSVIEDRDSWGDFPLPLIGWVYIRMAEIRYEWDELPSGR